MTRVRSGTRYSRAKLQPRHPKILLTVTPAWGRLQNRTDSQRLRKVLSSSAYRLFPAGQQKCICTANAKIAGKLRTLLAFL
jgi:hypothetical protein